MQKVQVPEADTHADASQVEKRRVGRPRKAPKPAPLAIPFGSQLVSCSIVHLLLLFANGAIFFFHKVVPSQPGTQRRTTRDAQGGTWSSLGFPHPNQSGTAVTMQQPPTHQPSNGLAPPTISSSSFISPAPGTTIPNLHTRPDYPTQRLIPEEDPQRTLDSADDDEDDDAVGDGLGDEDGEPNEEDEGDDELDGGEEAVDETESTRNSNPPRRPLPNWLREPFMARVAESSNRDSNGLPPLYAHQQTFWFPQPSTFFLLRQTSTPQKLFSPRFFLWDPDALCPRGIPCPNCQTTLQRHQVISRPRRCVDFNHTFWVIGYRYRCRKCTHPKSKKSTVTFRSWDSRILAMLPPALAAEFPAYLSHRSGISMTLFAWMRTCFNYGMGSKQFSDGLRMQHLLQYDTLELQYLEHLATNTLDDWLQHEYHAFPRFDDISAIGPHLYTPSATMCRNLYDNFIDKHRDEINQHTAMLTANICAIDHSHKV